MNRRFFTSDALLLLTAIIWGFAFVAQRVGMDYVGPFTFNGIRFALGSLVLIPFLAKRDSLYSGRFYGGINALVRGGGVAGAVLFAGASLQQIGLVYTTAGNAGFITGLYVVMVPILGLFWGQKTDTGTWLGALIATVGLYLLSVTGRFTIAFGDFLELLGAFFWAGHVLIIGRLSPKFHSPTLAFIQFAVCSLLSLIAAALFEEVMLSALIKATVPIAYAGALSVGVAYTLQVVGQKYAHPAHASILLSLEAVFAAVGGWLFLGEVLTPRGRLGCTLMLAGMLLSQLWAQVSHSQNSLH